MTPLLTSTRIGMIVNRHPNIDIIKLQVGILKTLRFSNLKFRELLIELNVRNPNLLDAALQNLRKSGQIHYVNHKKGWSIGKGRPYKPNQR